MTVNQLTQAERDCVSQAEINPHPDGRPWTKCCGTKDQCTCAMRREKAGKPMFTNILTEPASRIQACLNGTVYGLQHAQKLVNQLIRDKGRFFCCHRTTDDGFHRECAGWAAKYHPEKRNGG